MKMLYGAILSLFICLLFSCGQMGYMGDIILKPYDLVEIDDKKNNVDASATTNVPEAITGKTLKVAACEVTYIKWYEVLQKATSPSGAVGAYTFVNKGREGNDGNVGAVPNKYDNPAHIILGRRPVTTVSYADVLVWLNAYSEQENKKAVYQLQNTGDGNGSSGNSDSILRDATKVSNFSDIYVDGNAEGYRLLTENQYNALISSGVAVPSVLCNNGESEFFPAAVGSKDAHNGFYDLVGNAAEFVDVCANNSNTQVTKCKAVGLAPTTGNITKGKTVELGIKEVATNVSFRVCWYE